MKYTKKGQEIRKRWKQLVKFSIGEKVKVNDFGQWKTAYIVSHIGPEKYGVEFETGDYEVFPERLLKKY